MRAILALVAIIGALGAGISLIPAQQVSAHIQIPDTTPPYVICVRQDICGQPPTQTSNTVSSEVRQDESAAHTQVSETEAQLGLSAHVTRCYQPENGGFPTPEAPEPCGIPPH